MPLYEYHCPPCDLVFEELCSLGEAQTKKPCPDCGTKAPGSSPLLPFLMARVGNPMIR